MRLGTKAAAVAAAILFAVGMTPAAYASTVRPQVQDYPSDCTTAVHNSTATMTCTARPPTQQWHMEVYFCAPFTRYAQAGTEVTGNGTSTFTCDYGEVPASLFFIADN